MRTDTTSMRPIPPALIGAALDCLAQLPDGHRPDPTLLVAIAHAIGCYEAETPALLTRIRAAAIVMNDPRWPAWPVHLKTSTAEERQAFDAAMLRIIAELPLSPDLKFHADAFFDALPAPSRTAAHNVPLAKRLLRPHQENGPGSIPLKGDFQCDTHLLNA